MSGKKILCLCTALLILTGCAVQHDKNSSAETDIQTENNEESIAGTIAATAAPEESVTESEQEPEIIVNNSVVILSAESGFYPEAFSLELSAAENDIIYYTTDGSDPRTSDTRIIYTAPVEIDDRSGDKNVVSAVDPSLFSGNFCSYRAAQQAFVPTVSAPSDAAVDKCTIIRTASKAEDGSYSQVFAASYFIGTTEDHIEGIAKSCEAAGMSLAVISISMEYDDLFDPETGIYVKGNRFNEALKKHVASGEPIEAETARQLDANYKQRGKKWERSCHMEFFECSPDETISVLSQNCGIRIQGNYSRSDLQKGFRLYARSDYGDNKFRYPVFGERSIDNNGHIVDTFKTLELRAGGNCAFTAKFNDVYWQTLTQEFDYSTKASRPCVVYLNGEYWGLYVLEEDFSDNYFDSHYGVKNEDVVIYKGDAESYSSGYKLDEGTLPEGITDENYYFQELYDFFASHRNLEAQEDFDEFAKLVDVESTRDYFLTEIWANNKWDWPGKNWSMWKSAVVTPDSEYADGRWRFMLYDIEFGGVSGESDAYTNTIKEDNYKDLGLLDMNTNNPAVLCYAYLMTNENFRQDFNKRLTEASETTFEKSRALTLLNEFEAVYAPLYDQFFRSYPDTGTTEEAIEGEYASIKCIRDFLEKRAEYVPEMVEWADKQYN